MFHVIRWRRSENEYLVFTFTHAWSFRDVLWERLFANGPQVLESRLQE